MIKFAPFFYSEVEKKIKSLQKLIHINKDVSRKELT